jgi:hypothetical protein
MIFWSLVRKLFVMKVFALSFKFFVHFVFTGKVLPMILIFFLPIISLYFFILYVIIHFILSMSWFFCVIDLWFIIVFRFVFIFIVFFLNNLTFDPFLMILHFF